MSFKLSVKVVPGSSREGIGEWLGDALKVKVKAVAENGKANAAVEKLIAKVLSLSDKNAVTIVAGKTASRKIIEIEGISEKEAHDILTQVQK